MVGVKALLNECIFLFTPPRKEKFKDRVKYLRIKGWKYPNFLYPWLSGGDIYLPGFSSGTW